MRKISGIISILVGCIFFIAVLNVLFRWLILLSEKEYDAYGVSFLISYLVPGFIMATISFLLIRYGIRMLKKRDLKENLPSHTNND